MSKAALGAFSPEESARAAKSGREFLDDEWEGDPQLEGDARMLLAQAYRMNGEIDAALKASESAGRIFERQNQKAKTVDALLFATERAWQAPKVIDTN